MAIYEFCMFHNEHDVLTLKRQESGKWVDELHLVESNRTFKGSERPLVLPPSGDFLKTHIYDGATRFHPGSQWGVSRKFPFFRRKKMARKNETLQRNFVHEVLAEVADDDLVILSDVDEIIDSRHADEIVDAVRKHGAVSIEMHHTLFYLNLYSTNWHEVWPGSPTNYAYRVFVMTGERLRNLREKSDHLRRRGEWGQLGGEIHLLHGMKGFHHSWLGDEDAALEKLNSYAHSLHEHRPELADENGEVTRETLAKFIRSGESIFPGNEVEIRSFEQVEPLVSVRENPTKYARVML
jgi:hypothetical protein